MNDLISRQTAIDALEAKKDKSAKGDIGCFYNTIIQNNIDALKGLPYAQPEIKWETCFDCPLSHGCPKIKGCTNEQAIEYASQIPIDCPLSVRPEPKTGRWIDDNCSECGQYVFHGDVRNFCPSCGAKMLKDGEA